jgi:hypothetical protein
MLTYEQHSEMLTDLIATSHREFRQTGRQKYWQAVSSNDAGLVASLQMTKNKFTCLVADSRHKHISQYTIDRQKDGASKVAIPDNPAKWESGVELAYSMVVSRMVVFAATNDFDDKRIKGINEVSDIMERIRTSPVLGGNKVQFMS